ncbi:hypothetical protein FRC19_004784 [Serendipita sp. 401]|nr:hypothetical protein FRC19_004784 [Serendipita sp. 401]
MPNRRITIVLNANQTKRITVLIPLPSAGDASYSMKEHILTHARNKFHNKYLCKVFLWGGEEVLDGDILSEKEEEVLVSKGEAYIGPPKTRTRQNGVIGQVTVLANESFVHEDVRPFALFIGRCSSKVVFRPLNNLTQLQNSKESSKYPFNPPNLLYPHTL